MLMRLDWQDATEFYECHKAKFGKYVLLAYYEEQPGPGLTRRGLFARVPLGVDDHRQGIEQGRCPRSTALWGIFVSRGGYRNDINFV